MRVADLLIGAEAPSRSKSSRRFDAFVCLVAHFDASCVSTPRALSCLACGLGFGTTSGDEGRGHVAVARSVVDPYVAIGADGRRCAIETHRKVVACALGSEKIAIGESAVEGEIADAVGRRGIRVVLGRVDRSPSKYAHQNSAPWTGQMAHWSPQGSSHEHSKIVPLGRESSGNWSGTMTQPCSRRKLSSTTMVASVTT